jgi:tetratricopeptide (TPR) repeat protein
MHSTQINSRRLSDVVALGVDLICAAKPQIAAEMLEQIQGVFPDSLGARLLAQRLSLAGDRPGEALEGARESLRIDPLNPAVLAIELRARQALAESGEGLATARGRLAAIAPDHPQLGPEPLSPSLAGIGFMHLRQGRQLLAQRWLGEAMPAEDWPELGSAIAQLQLECGQIRLALESARAVLAMLPDCLPANLVCAQANAELGKLALADKHLKRARRFDPELALARRLYARLAVSRLELPSAPKLDLPEMLLARAQRVLDPPDDPVADSEPAPEPIGDYSPPSPRFLPADEAGGEPTGGPEDAAKFPEPHVLAATGELARLMESDQWPAALDLLRGSAHLLDAGQLDSLPVEHLPRLADELVRLNHSDLAVEAYRLAELRSPPPVPESAENEP